MGKPTGFMEYDRALAPEQPCATRIRNWDEFHPVQDGESIRMQAARCMNCGIPFCHAGVSWRGVSSGCTIANLIPEWNHLVYMGRDEEAYRRLEMTNPLHEFTSRVCPALCEGSCTAGLNGEPVAIREIERYLSDTAWENGWVKPHPPASRNGFTVAVIGSGPAGLTAAHYLNSRGFTVTVYEKSEEPGGLLMFGIPNMKLPKDIVRRRIELFRQEGVQFLCGIDVGRDLPVAELDRYDAVLLCGGAGQPRDLSVTGRNLPGVQFAVPFLADATRRLLAEQASARKTASTATGQGDTPATSGQEALSATRDQGVISATSDQDPEKPLAGRRVVVIGGGDTGNDCVGTAIRMGAASVVQLEIMPPSPETRAQDNPWPRWPFVFKTDYGQKEAIWLYGRDPRSFEVTAVSIEGSDETGVTAIETVQVVWTQGEKGRYPKPLESTRRRIPATDVLLAMGFVGAETYLPEALSLQTSRDAYQTSRAGFFAAGDMRTGQSLVVRAEADAKKAAQAAEKWLLDKAKAVR